MENILLLTDFSTNANNAIDYAMQLFKDDDVNFKLLNVQKVSRYITSDLITSPKKSVYDAVIKKPKKTLEILVDDLRKKYNKGNFSFEGVCDYDSFISAVKQIVEIKNIDLVVMGTNGISGVKETIFGSNTIQIIKKIDLPILVIPENYQFVKPEEVLLINDAEMEAYKNSMNILSHIISKFDTQVNVLTIDDKRENLNSYFKGVKLNVIDGKGKSLVHEIELYNSKNEIHLIAKAINLKSFFKRFFSTSTYPKIAYASKVPLLFL